MSELLHLLFATSSFIPYGHCYLWNPGLVWLHLLSDALISLSYYSIPVTLLYFVHKRQDVPFKSLFLLFGAFIVACATTHVMAIWTLWYPTYWLSGVIKALTAIVSVYTAIVLIQLLPKAIEIPSTVELETANQKLQQEIIERQRVEDALRDSERRFRAIFDQTFQFMGLLHPDGTLLEANQTALKFGGLMYADVINRPFWETEWWTIGEANQNRLKAAIAQAASGQFFRGEFDIQGAGNTQTTVDFSLKPVFDDTEEVVLLIAESRDIGDRKRTEAALRRTHDELEIRVQQRTAELLEVNQALQLEVAERQRVEAKLRNTTTLQRAILDSANYTIISTTPDGIILTFNTAASRWLGYAVTEVVGKVTPAIIHDWDEIVKVAQELSEELGVTIEPGFEVFVAKARRGQIDEREWSYIRKDGSRFPVLLSVTALRDTENNITGFLGIGSDISKRKATESALRRSEHRYASLVQAAPVGIFRSNASGRCIFINEQACEIIGSSREEILGEGWIQFLHPEDRQRVLVEWYQTVQQNLPFKSEYRFCRPDGRITWVISQAVAEIESTEEVTGYIGTITDISDRKRAEEELQKQAFLLDLTHDTIMVLGPNGRIEFWNRGAEEMYGWTKAEAIGQISHTLLQTQFPQPLAEIKAELLQHGRWEGELIHTKRDGTPVVAASRWALQRDQQGRPQRTLEINNDITKRKQAEEELRHLSKALESAVEGISQLDTQGRYIKVNPAYAKAVGYQPEEIIGMDWQVTVYPEDLERLKTAYQQMLIHGKVEAEGRAVRKDKSIFDKQIVMVKAYDQQQQFIGHYCFMKDISDRREVERLKDEFVSVVSHELRTPLTSIAGALDLLASGVLQTAPEDAQRMLNIAASNTDRLVRLINDILDIERIASGKVEMNQQTCNVADLMIDSAEVMEEMATQAGVKLAVSPLSAQIWADSDRIIQVFTNLLSNAIKFSPPDSTVWLSAELVTGEENQKAISPTVQAAEAKFPYILFQVKDQGRGIPTEKLESIFERFGQVDASDSRQKGGTGLGLAICRTILQHHGGYIWVESSLGEGSTFFFTLPIIKEADTGISSLSPSSTEADATSFPLPILPSSHPPVVLACDDDPSIRIVLQTMLERQGYRVMAVASGQEAVEQATLHHPDAIILNLMMPGMDGWETLAVLKQQPQTQNIPVIILSGLLPDAHKGFPDQISDWIVKPPNFQLLCQALEKATAKQNQSIKVLVIEDDLDLAQVLIAMFNRYGVTSFYAQTGREAIQISQKVIPDLLVLDLGLPEYDGFAVVDWLRQHQRLCQVPLVVYTARDLDESDRQRLKLGQTLFFTKGRITAQEFEKRVLNLLNRMISSNDR
ncbi:PAS/PAC sensor hybrid histidine kinase [Nostoc sp. NIES-4103]|nr:PAS/PAC sensor hybrid histidine kinase [Nostoc sp. NIES-4103]